MNRQRTRAWSEYCSTCAATLRPGNGARSLVLLSGWVLLLAGLVITLHLNAHPAARAMIALAWLAATSRRLYRQALGFRSISRLVIEPGGPNIRAEGRSNGPCELLAGSLVLRRACWFRLRLPCGREHAELVLAAESSADDWRRLQTLWRWGRSAHE